MTWMRNRGWVGSVLLLGVVLLGVSTTPIRSQSSSPEPSFRPVSPRSDADTSGVEFFPEGELYPVYVLSPRTPRFGVGLQYTTDGRIPGTSKDRLSISMGGQYGIVRFGKNWQLDFGAGFLGWFDRGFSLDNIGWDGIYTGSLSHRFSEWLRLRLAFQHVSAHKGDEYVIRTGEDRVDYTREEWALGLRYDLTDRLSGYLEGGWGVVFSNENLQEPGRLEAGLEFRDSLPEWNRHLGWYLMGDFESMEERDWQIDSRVGVGLSFTRGERLWRLGILYHRGRVPLGEFFQNDEDYVEFGFWMDP